MKKFFTFMLVALLVISVSAQDQKGFTVMSNEITYADGTVSEEFHVFNFSFADGYVCHTSFPTLNDEEIPAAQFYQVVSYKFRKDQSATRVSVVFKSTTRTYNVELYFAGEIVVMEMGKASFFGRHFDLKTYN